MEFASQEETALAMVVTARWLPLLVRCFEKGGQDLGLTITERSHFIDQDGKACPTLGGRSANVSEKVSFLVEKTDKGVRVMVRGQPKTEEVIPLAALKESINKAAYAFTDKHVGPKEEVGNKGGSLSNRLRAVLNV